MREPVPFPPERRTLLIGRRAQCDLQPDGDDVAPVHAVLFVMNGTRFVRDLNTPGGTFVNGEAIHQAELRAGDVLRVGAMTMQYVKAPAPSDEELGDEPARPGESRIPLVDEPTDEPLDESQRSDAPLIAVAGEAEPPPVDQPEDGVPSIESRADALLGGSSIVGEIFESHYDMPAPPPPAPAPDAPAEPSEPALIESAVARLAACEAAAETGQADVQPDAAVTESDAPSPEQERAQAAEPEHLDVVELPGAHATPANVASGDPQSNGSSPASLNGDGPAIELVPAAGVAVPENPSRASPSDADEKYVVPLSELTLTTLPAAAASELHDNARPHRDPRADAAGATIAGEEVITTLVDELANRATTLKTAWEEHRSKHEE